MCIFVCLFAPFAFRFFIICRFKHSRFMFGGSSQVHTCLVLLLSVGCISRQMKESPICVFTFHSSYYFQHDLTKSKMLWLFRLLFKQFNILIVSAVYCCLLFVLFIRIVFLIAVDLFSRFIAVIILT